MVAGAQAASHSDLTWHDSERDAASLTSPRIDRGRTLYEHQLGRGVPLSNSLR